MRGQNWVDGAGGDVTGYDDGMHEGGGGGRRDGSFQTFAQEAAGEALRVEEREDDQGCDYGEVGGESEEHPFGRSVDEDAAGFKGGVFKHGVSLRRSGSAGCAS